MATILIDRYDLEANAMNSKTLAKMSIGDAEIVLYRFSEDAFILDLRDFTQEDDMFRGVFIANISFHERRDEMQERSMKYRKEIVRTELPDNELE